MYLVLMVIGASQSHKQSFFFFHFLSLYENRILVLKVDVSNLIMGRWWLFGFCEGQERRYERFVNTDILSKQRVLRNTSHVVWCLTENFSYTRRSEYLLLNVLMKGKVFPCEEASLLNSSTWQESQKRWTWEWDMANMCPLSSCLGLSARMWVGVSPD